MAIFASELTEVAPKDPVTCCVVGNYIVAIGQGSGTSGLMPNGSFSVLNTSTEGAKAYTGLNTTNNVYNDKNHIPFTAASDGTYAWVTTQDGKTLYRITPSTGGVTTISLGGGSMGAHRTLVCDGYVCVISNNGAGGATKTYKISDGTINLATNGAIGGNIFAAAVYGTQIVFKPQTGNFARWSPSTDVAVTNIAPLSGFDQTGRGVAIGSVVYFSRDDSIAAVDVSAGTTTIHDHTLTPGGYIGGASDLVLHSDGKLYAYGASNYLIAFDPSNGTFGKAALSPSRARRYTVASANGKLWIPSGVPLT